MDLNKQVSRRTIAKGAAWSVPAVMIASAAPAAAASERTPHIAGFACMLYFGTGGVNGQRTQIFPGFISDDGVIKAGDTAVYNFEFSNSVKVPTIPQSPEFDTKIDPPTGTDTTKFTLTVTAKQDNPPSLTTCNGASPSLNWSDSASSNDSVMPPKTRIKMTSQGYRNGEPTEGSAGLTFEVPQRFPTSINKAGRTPLKFIEKSGLQTKFPAVKFTIRGNVDNGRNRVCTNSGTAIIYPDGGCQSYTGTASGGEVLLDARS